MVMSMEDTTQGHKKNYSTTATSWTVAGRAAVVATIWMRRGRVACRAWQVETPMRRLL